MRARAALGLAATLAALGAGVAGPASAAPTKVGFTLYAYAETGPHSLLADPSQGVSDRWDLSSVGSGATADDVVGTMDMHGWSITNKAGQLSRGRLTLTPSTGTTSWTGKYLKGLQDQQAQFGLEGNNGTDLVGYITWVDAGVVRLDGLLRR